jgi:serine/threonine protein kinase/formylglycine-generating enzyme required for sulfatase activity
MGVVYRAEQLTPKRSVALKVMQPHLFSPRTRKRFEVEVEALGRLQHPGIARIYDAGTFASTHGDRPYFAMELIEGRSLLRFFSQQNKPTVSDKISLFAEVCDAVHHAHQKGVIHRDLKPGNILVDGTGRPRIVDFGLAKATDPHQFHSSQQTRSGEFLGTIDYMSPEQTGLEVGEVDTQTDIFSLGSVLYELLTGSLPHSTAGKGMLEAFHQIREQSPPSPSQLEPNLDSDIDTVVLKCLEKEQAQRYSSASALATDLRRYLGHEPILARPPNLLYQLRKLARRNRLAFTSTAAVLLALVAGTLLALAGLREAQAQAKIAKESLESFELAANFSKIASLEELQLGLWPARPHILPAIHSWLDEAAGLIESKPRVEESLSRLRIKAHQNPKPKGQAGSKESLEFANPADAWLYYRLLDYQKDLTILKATRIPAVLSRRESARGMQKRTVVDFQDEWDEAVFDISESSLYQGLSISFQTGLVPLGIDPESGLWEFWHVETGERPQRDPDNGALVMTRDSGIVLILIPGGTFWMGSQKKDSKDPNYDPESWEDERPTHECTVVPFFLSKYEMTQGQWFRLTGHNPAAWQGRNFLHDNSRPGGFSHPVEQVSWAECSEVLPRYDLQLPTETQWEYAARGGTQSPWWTGKSRESLRGNVNIADQSQNRKLPTSIFEDWLDDGYAVHAAVGSLPANPFGLHEVLGNVWEWCMDCFVYYDRHYDDPTLKGFRGGAYSYKATDARSAARQFLNADARSETIGVRPAKALTP